MNPRAGRPGIVLAICCLSLLLVTLDVTIVNVALPAIRADLGASVAGLQWSVDAYTVVVASFLMLAGSIGDRFGRRRTFQMGLAVFSLGSLLSSLAESTEALIAFRAVQALGGSMLNPIAMSIVVGVFPEGRGRARALGVWGGVFGVSMALGPVLGGLLVEAVGWRSVFWVNVPLGVLALLLTARFVPESRGARPRRFDPVAQALIVVGLLALTSALIDGRRVGWTSWAIVARFGVALAASAALVAYERRRVEPLLDPALFRRPAIASVLVVAVLSFASFSGVLFLGALYLQEARGLSAAVAGLVTLPIALGILVGSPLSGRLVGAGRARLVIVASGVALSVGALLLTRLAADSPIGLLLAAYGLVGLGVGSVGAPVNVAATSGVPTAQAGLAAAFASTARQIGAALGVALAGSFASAALDEPTGADLASATRPVFWFVAFFGCVIAAVGLFVGAEARIPAAKRGRAC